MMKYCKIFLLCSLMSMFSFIHTEDVVTPISFINPVSHKIYLAGNFGELRHSHFHAGLDIKPSSSNREGDPILSVADGYISRIKIDRAGYGRCVYITHDNGYTSVYAHLSNFGTILHDYVFSLQQQAQSYEIEVFPDAQRLQVKQGEVIGFLGNSGQSYGAHLHFEIRETTSEIPVNPSIFGIKGEDTSAPIIETCTIHGLDEHMHKVYDKTYKTYKNKDGETQIIQAHVPTAQAGISLFTYDRMNGVPNKNGIYKLTMTVDNEVYYQFSLDKVSFEESAQIDVHTDYETKIRNGRSEVLCYQLPGNELSFISTSTNRGIIELTEGMPRLIRIEVGDIDGNITTQYITISKLGNLAPQITSFNPHKWLSQGKADSFDINGIILCFGDKCLPYDIPMNLNTNTNGEGTSFNIGDSGIPLLNTAKIMFPLSYAAGNALLVKKEGHKFYAPKYEIVDDRYVAHISDFGNYQFYIDRIMPTISSINFSPNPKAGAERFRFTLKDDVSSKVDAIELKYSVYIDDAFYPCEYKGSNETLYIPIWRDGNVHRIRIEALDFAGNKSTWLGEYNAS